MNPNRDHGNEKGPKDVKRPFGGGGNRDFRVEAERDSDEEVGRVIRRLEGLLEEGGLTESAGRIVGRQLHAYQQESRRRQRDRAEGAGRTADRGQSVGK